MDTTVKKQIFIYLIVRMKYHNKLVIKLKHQNKFVDGLTKNVKININQINAMISLLYNIVDKHLLVVNSIYRYTNVNKN